MPVDPGGRRPFTVSAPHLTMLVVCVVAVYFIVGFYGKSLDSYRMSQRARAVRQEISLLEAQNRELQASITYLQSDAYVETAGRDKLNLARPGDRSVVIVPAPSAPVGPPGPPPGRGATPRLPDFGHLEEWVEFFFGAR